MKTYNKVSKTNPVVKVDDYITLLWNDFLADLKTVTDTTPDYGNDDDLF